MTKSYQPDSLHPYIMDTRLKKATGSGGISNIPIASADTVGGIKIGGSANPITINGSGNASVRKATSELLGVVKAGAGVSVDADGAISTTINMLSNTDYLTNKVLNGKPVYARYINLEAAVGDRDVLTDVDEIVLCNLKIIANDFVTILPAYNFQYNTSFTYRLNITSHTIEFKTSDNNTSYAMTGYIEYTKPTP